MTWEGSLRTFLPFAFLIFVICSATLPTLGLQDNKSILSYGTINYSATPTPIGFQPPDGKCYIGAWTDGKISYSAASSFVRDIKTKTGKGVFILGVWNLWYDPNYDPLDRLEGAQALYQDGIIGGYALGWLPWRPSVANESKSDTQTITQIANGFYDNYIRDIAKRMRETLTAPFFIVFGGEMNGDWHGYGYDPAVYTKAWRRIHDIFREAGVKAEWVFQPNNQPSGQYPQALANRRPWKEYYPGDEYVDWISVSWHAYSTYGMYRDKTIDQIFAEGEYLKFAEQHNKPFMFSETGTDGYGATQYKVPLSYQIWFINQLFDFMNRNNRVKAFIWYDLPYTLSILETLNAYRQGIANPRYIDVASPTQPTPPQEAFQSLLKNPSFEEDKDGNGIPDSWSNYKTTGVDAVFSWVADPHTGQKAVRIEIAHNPSVNQYESALWSQSVYKFTIGKTYNLRVWYRSTVTSTILVLAFNGTSSLIKVVSLDLPASSTWQQSGWVSLVLPAGTVTLRVDGRLFNRANGWVVFDDFELLEA